jgi:type IX secretion system PorP/SprF family membrane protein
METLMRLKRLQIIVFLLSASFTALAQDPHFSQFFASPLTLNPALTGKFDGNFRVAGNYRNQWPTINRAFITSTIAADFTILNKTLPYNDRWGVGAMAYTDAQADGVLKNTFYSIATAYHKGLDENGDHQLSLGFQATYAQKRLNTTNLKFEDQLRSDGFTGITNEIFDPRNLNINYFDLNAGFVFSGLFGEATNYYAGVSMYHINKPQESFTGALFYLNPRYTVHGGVYLPVGATTTLHTSAIYQNQSGAQELVFGAAIGFNLNDDMDYKPTNFYAGSWMRWNDAIIPYAGLEFGNFRLGVSYDINISSLKTVSNSQGGFEISLMYINKKDDQVGIKCPKF